MTKFDTTTAENTLYVAIELSASAWLAAVRLPGVEKVNLHRMDAGDTTALLAFIAMHRARAEERLGAAVEVVSCFEAGRDGFWLHRWLLANGVDNRVVEPTSILVSRRARRAKTDRLDAQGLLRVLSENPTACKVTQLGLRERSAPDLRKRDEPGLRPQAGRTYAKHHLTTDASCKDEARVGNKGRLCHRWWPRGERAPGRCEHRYQWTYLFTAIRPATGEDFTLVLPVVGAEAMSVFLKGFAETLPPGVHAVMVLDGAGWHDPRALDIPDSITLVQLPPPDQVRGRLYSPELNPVERVWLYLRERFLSLRLLDDREAVVDACCNTWNALVAEPGRLRSLCAYPWITKVCS